MIFDLHDEHLAYGETRVLAGVSLRVERGERVALVGPSGSGKTSLLRRLFELAPEAAFVHQDHALVPTTSVFHNVLVGRLDRCSVWRNLANLVRPGTVEKAEVSALLAALGIEAKLFERVGTLSGGQQQRVAVARALYRGENLLLADEPVSSVDPRWAGQVLELLLRHCETMVVSLHSVRLAQRHFPRMVGLREGRVLFDLPTEQVDEALLIELYQPC